MNILTATLVACVMAIAPAFADSLTLGKSTLGGPDTLGGTKAPLKLDQKSKANGDQLTKPDRCDEKGEYGWKLGKSKLGVDTKL